MKDQKSFQEIKGNWLARINRKNLTENQLGVKNFTLNVCSNHFISGQRSELYETCDPDWTPSIILGYSSQNGNTSGTERLNRRKRRRELPMHQQQAEIDLKMKKDVEKKETTTSSSNFFTQSEESLQTSEELFNTFRCQTEFDIDQELVKLQEENAKLRNENLDLKKQLDNFMYTKDKFKNNEELVTYNTGLTDFNALNALFDLVKLDIVTKRGKLNPFEMLILCLMRLRHGLAVVDLANRFQICKITVSKVFLLVLGVLYVKLTPVIIWPERSELIASKPMCSRAKFGTKITTKSQNCFELYIERPTNLTARSLTQSYYESNNTLS